MIIFLHGPDEYRRLQKKKEITAEFRKKHAVVGVDIFDLEKKDEVARFKDFVGSQSLFDTKKMAVLENAFSSEISDADKKELAAGLKEVAKSDSTTVLISEKNKTSEDFPFLSRKIHPHIKSVGVGAGVKSQDFSWLTGPKWETFISEIARENGVVLKHNAVEFLAEVYQNDTWGLATELEKISVLKNPSTGSEHERTIGLDDLRKLDLEISQDFFELLKNLKNYALENRLASLEKLFSANEPMPKVFNMIAYQIPDKLPQLAKYDVLVKSGKLDYEEALVDLIV